VIVGVGLPAVCSRREAIRGYFAKTMGTGFEFAYQYPGINRVLQAAGRVIRSETDRGVVVLIDERFGQKRYCTLFPPHWQVQSVADCTQLREALSEFWGVL
jgi:DNA excision repair protein ERCC-2